MSKIKRLRVFAGPNGSGKSTLFDSISSKFNAGYFINSDLIEKEISSKGFIDLDRYELKLTEKDFEENSLEKTQDRTEILFHLFHPQSVFNASSILA